MVNKMMRILRDGNLMENQIIMLIIGLFVGFSLSFIFGVSLIFYLFWILPLVLSTCLLFIIGIDRIYNIIDGPESNLTCLLAFGLLSTVIFSFGLCLSSGISWIILTNIK